MGISKIWMEMEQKIKGFIQGGNKGKVLYLQVPAGVGKSHITTKAINDLFPVGKGDVTWFGSMHDQFNDLGNLRASNWVHVMGRQGCNCKYAKEAKILYGRGISIPDNLCGKRCGGGCDYWKQLKQPGHKFLPHQMLFFFDGKKTPLVVFDELDVKVFLQPYSVDANELVRLARAEHKDLWDAFYKLMTENKFNIVVNCRDLSYISSAGLGVFMAYVEDVRKNKGDIKLTNMTPKVYNVFDLLGFPILYEIFKDEQEAVVRFHETKK